MSIDMYSTFWLSFRSLYFPIYRKYQRPVYKACWVCSTSNKLLWFELLSDALRKPNLANSSTSNVMYLLPKIINVACHSNIVLNLSNNCSKVLLFLFYSWLEGHRSSKGPNIKALTQEVTAKDHSLLDPWWDSDRRDIFVKVILEGDNDQFFVLSVVWDPIQIVA